ncbi:MAG TPA: hypothetical protein VNI78_04740 [Vicinamibacterales bacterium]|nr:hypothetical protein [Vicinamibacterales bacterium]
MAFAVACADGETPSRAPTATPPAAEELDPVTAFRIEWSESYGYGDLATEAFRTGDYRSAADYMRRDAQRMLSVAHNYDLPDALMDAIERTALHYGAAAVALELYLDGGDVAALDVAIAALRSANAAMEEALRLIRQP